MKPIRVLIVEDSITVTKILEHIIEADPRLKLVGSAASGEEALTKIQKIKPDVISMDIRLPGMNGFEVTREVMHRFPTPIVVVSASVESDELQISMNALKAGALSIVEKPTGTRSNDYEKKAQEICDQLALMSQVQVISQKKWGLGEKIKEIKGAFKSDPIVPSQFCEVIGVVASTGGPKALVEVLNPLPADFPLPILIVQHITGTFFDGFVAWLDDQIPLSVKKAESGEKIQESTVYLAPAGLHMGVSSGKIKLFDGEEVSHQKPSGTLLLKSLAESYGSRACGIILTGMGDDGAIGLVDIHTQDGYTIAESENTAVVFGMPKVAQDLGATKAVLNLRDIPKTIVKLTTGRDKKNGGRKESKTNLSH